MGSEYMEMWWEKTEYRKQEQILSGMIMSFTMNMWSLKYQHSIHGAVSIGSLKFRYGEIQAKDWGLGLTGLLIEAEVKSRENHPGVQSVY